MRDFMFHSEELLDRNALSFLEKESISGVLPCRFVRWNSLIQLLFFIDALAPLSQRLESLEIDDLRNIGKDIIDCVKSIEEHIELSPENIVWDIDSIYLDDDNQVYIICLPAVVPIESLESRIYVKRLYALLNEIFSGNDERDFIWKQIEAQREKNIENLDGIKDAIDRHEPETDESIVIRSINTPDPLEFTIEHNDFIIGSGESANGFMQLPGISSEHAMIGWNEISFFVRDFGSEKGTYLNDVKIEPNVDIPLGSGSILKFGDFTFNVE